MSRRAQSAGALPNGWGRWHIGFGAVTLALCLALGLLLRANVTATHRLIGAVAAHAREEAFVWLVDSLGTALRTEFAGLAPLASEVLQTESAEAAAAWLHSRTKEAAEATLVRIDSMPEPRSELLVPGIVAVSARYRAKGDLEALLSWIARLETLRVGTRVDSVSIAVHDSAGLAGRDILSAVIVLRLAAVLADSPDATDGTAEAMHTTPDTMEVPRDNESSGLQK